MKKITFYGQDFTLISKAEAEEHVADAEIKKHTLEEEIAGCDGLTYSALLEQFVKNYTIPKKDLEDHPDDDPNGNSLYFCINSEKMFGRWAGVFRNKNFQEETTKESFDVTLEIRCRFDTKKKAFFLAAMLLCLTNDSLHFTDQVNTTFHQVMDIFLLFMFKHQLAEAAEKGIFRKYQRFENNDSRPHGTIDIARHIRENMGLESGNIAYHYRELTANNPVNRLILAAYKRLCEKFPGHINREESVYSTLKMLQTELGYSKPNVSNVVKENLRPITHPYFLEYEILRKTCLKILRDENVSIFDADCSEETDAIYCDITRLWEDYIKYQFQKLELSDEYEFELAYQEQKPFLEGLFYRFARPDFVLKKSGKNVSILDAKFKKYWENYRTNYHFLRDDIFKCIRDKDLFETQRTGVIFPTESEDILETGRSPFFDLVGIQVLKIEENQPFEEWKCKLDQHVIGILGEYLTRIGCANISDGCVLEQDEARET